MVVDADNYVPLQRDGKIKEIENGTAAGASSRPPVYTTDLDTEGVHKALAAASPERPAESRA